MVSYFLGDRKLGGFVSALSYSATTYSAFMLVGLAGLTYKGGVGAFGFEIIYFMGVSLVAFFGPRFWLVMLEARKSLHARIYKGLQSAKDEGLTWKDLDLDIVAWTIILMVENSPEKAEQSGSPLEYDEMAKVICRLVFPPQIMEKLCVSKAESKR